MSLVTRVVGEPVQGALRLSTADTAAASDVGGAAGVVTPGYTPQNYPRTGADTAAATDVATRAATRARTGSDTALGTDTGGAAGAKVLVRTGSDSAPATDAGTRLGTRSRTSTDTAGGTDSLAAAKNLLRTASDSAPGTDVGGAVGAKSKSVTGTDSAPATDAGGAVGHTYYLYRTGNDPPVFTSDAAVKTHLRVRTAPDTALGTDSAVGASQHFRAIGDSTPGFSDAATRSQMLGRTNTDTAGGTDSVARPVIYSRSVSDAVTGSDGVSAATTRALTRSGTDSANSVSGQVNNLIDTPVRTLLLLRSAPDLGYSFDANIEQFASPRRSLSKPISHPVFALRSPTSLVDRASVLTMHFHGCSDALSTSDQVTSFVFKDRASYDAVAGTDALVRYQSLVRRPSESVDGSDAVERLVFRLSQPSLPAVGLASSAATFSGQTLYRTASDRVYAMEALGPPGVRSFARVATDSAPATDVVTRTTRRVVRTDSLTPAQGMYDSPATFSGQTLGPRSASDAAPATDSASAVKVLPRSATESISTLVETLTKLTVHPRSVTDSAPAVEAAPLNTLAVHPRTASDSAPASDVNSTKRTDFRSGTDSALATDAATRVAVLKRTSTEAVLGTDSPVINSAHPRLTSDTAPATDVATRSQVAYRTITAAVLGTDSLVSNVGLRARFALDTALADDGLYVPRNIVVHLYGVESTTLVDNPSKMQRFPRLVEDGAGYGFEQVTTATMTSRTTSDSAPASDTQAHLGSQFRTGAESVFGVDYVIRTAPKFRTASDIASEVYVDNITRFHDEATRVITLIRDVDESTGGTDAVLHLSNLTRRFYDAAPVSDDTALRSILYYRWTAEDISLPAGVYDVALVIPKNQREASDSVHALETLTHQVLTGYYRTASDQAAAADAATKTKVTFLTGADSAPASDSVTRSAPKSRYSVVSVGGTDSVARYVQLLRLPADSAPAVDSGTSARSQAQRLNDTAHATDSAGVSDARYFRTVQDQVQALDVGTGVHLYTLYATDSVAGLSESLTRTLRRVRSGTDDAPASDVLVAVRYSIRVMGESALATDTATRSQVIARVLAEVVRGLDSSAGSHVSSARSGADAASASDLVTYLRTKVRSGTDLAPAIEAVARALAANRRIEDVVRTYGDWADLSMRGIRTVTDLAHASDEVTSIPISVRSGADTAPAADASQSATIRPRSGLDAAGGADWAARAFSGARALYEWLTTTDSPTREAAKVRFALDFLTTSDGLVDVEAHYPAFGPPIARILSVSRTKVSSVDGYDSARVVFEFDQPVAAWTIRVGSTCAFDGVEVASWSAASALGFGLAPFGTSPFGSVFETVLTGMGEIFDDDLSIGSNDVAIYGRDAKDRWSAPDRSPALSGAL